MISVSVRYDDGRPNSIESIDFSQLQWTEAIEFASEQSLKANVADVAVKNMLAPHEFAKHFVNPSKKHIHWAIEVPPEIGTNKISLLCNKHFLYPLARLWFAEMVYPKDLLQLRQAGFRWNLFPITEEFFNSFNQHQFPPK